MLAPAVLMLLALDPVWASRPEPLLEGTAWKLLVERDAVPEGLWTTDLLVFGRKRFAALEYLTAGFSPSVYRVEREGDAVRWSAELQAPSGHLVHFDGVRRGRRMTGNLRWLDPEGASVELPWKAIIRPPPNHLPSGL
ncbi:MAG: hypothetical protein HY553_11620 [Elusimicrobia bacterium]|nr:hypothetical protein [Elusimicrobiota bacterium]